MQLPMPGIHTPSTLQQRITTTPFTFAIALGVPRTPAPRPRPPPGQSAGCANNSTELRIGNGY